MQRVRGSVRVGVRVRNHLKSSREGTAFSFPGETVRVRGREVFQQERGEGQFEFESEFNFDIGRSCFFPRASERRVLPIVGVCLSSSHLHIFSLHIFSSSHLLIFTSSHLDIFSLHIFSSSHLLIFTSSHLLIFTSSHLHICSSSHLLIFTSAHLHICSSSHLLIFTSSHFTSHFTSSHLHIFSSSHLHIFSSSHLHICSSSYLLIFTSSHPHIFTSSPLALLPSPSFIFLF